MQAHEQIGSDDHVRGPQDAALTLVEYGDFQCPYCARAHAALSELMDEIGDEAGGIRLVYRHLPLLDMHPLAGPAAEASEAAASQGKFWEMHDSLFEQQQELADEDDLATLASELGLDGARFTSELAQGKHRARVQADLARGEKEGAAQTPTFFINGVQYHGDSDRDSLEAALRGAIKK